MLYYNGLGRHSAICRDAPVEYELKHELRGYRPRKPSVYETDRQLLRTVEPEGGREHGGKDETECR